MQHLKCFVGQIISSSEILKLPHGPWNTALYDISVGLSVPCNTSVQYMMIKLCNSVF